MIVRTLLTTGAGLAALGLLAGCGAATPAPPTEITVTASPTTTPSASPTATQSPRDKAIAAAGKAVLAYSQTFADILSSSRPNIDDLHKVATDPQLAIDQRYLVTYLSKKPGPSPAGQMRLVWTRPVKVNLKADPPTVVLKACLDQSDLLPSTSTVAPRDWMNYTVVALKTYEGDRRWKVADVQFPEGAAGKAGTC